jgi:glutamyl-tRNA reductase
MQDKALMEARKVLKEEMERVIHCRNRDEVKRVVAGWKGKYSSVMEAQLKRLARDRKNRVIVANWDLGNFDEKRLKG